MFWNNNKTFSSENIKTKLAFFYIFQNEIAMFIKKVLTVTKLHF